ncbi:endolytic transglycosylase MltG [Porticoccus sp. W117]|uniref:endolytic transglycosylase MltG n=1 Tax=Porticoccus sp. W117 TaxID=3054777 RepID=UPI002592367D|nr:endolytic transglycosylase MltG [Porticoccus sp. W117]MDM3869731.1 endolytic transglycosylase MltG [Porticoccus sp. W117]
MFSLLKRCFIVLALLVVMLSLASYWWLQRYVQQPLPLQQSVELRVESGSNLTRVLQKLEAENALFGGKPQLAGVRVYARLSGLTDIQAGDYRLQPGVTPTQLLQQLNSGQVVYHQVTLPEGLTVKQWLQRLRQQPHLSSELSDSELLAFINGNPEGWLFPDSYRYQRGDSIEQILQQSHQAMKETLEKLWQQRDVGLPYQTPYEALIMASIIEKETGVDWERPQIAGVFVRRLQKGMRLQTDPTVIYGLGDRYQGNLTRSHLREKTAYNTYVIKGLPPTPIANPGADAIYAALHPAEGEALYFVAKGDGSHYFSATLAEHEKAVDKYQRKQRRSDYRSAPVN